MVDNGREVPDITASPGRAPPVPNTRPAHPPPMVIQGDFRKVSGISTEIFKQIETVENDHDATTAAALEAVERRGEMIVRILDPRHLGRAAGEAAKKFLSLQDAKHIVQLVEIVKRPGQTLGLYIREGNGIDRNDGVFISRIALESAVYNSGCLKVGDEILAVNLVDVTRMSLDDVVIIMSIPRRLVLATRQRKGAKGGMGSPSVQPRAEHKPPPVVVIKRDLREDENDDEEHSNRDASIRQRHGGDGREMSESRSRLGLGLSGYDPSRHGAGGTTSQDSNGGLVDLYYNSRPPDSSSNNWGYQPPPPVITEQPKPSMQHFQAPYERGGPSGYPKTLESLAEKVHSFYSGPPPPGVMGNGRRMSAGAQPLSSRLSSGGQSSPSSYYVQHTGTGARRLMPRSGSDQHLPRVEYSDYTSITQAGRHSLLRSSLKSGSTLSRYNQRYVDQSASTQLAQNKYSSGASQGQYSSTTGGTLTRRNRSSLDYSSDTEATCGPRSSYYYYRNQPSIPHSTIPTLARNNTLTSTDISTKFNSLPRDSRGSTRMQLSKRFGDRSTVSLLSQDESDGTLSAPEMPTSGRRDRGRIPSSSSVFTSDEYRAWLSRTPSTSAIYEQIRASRDVLNQQRAARFTYSAENIHAALKEGDSSYYGGYGSRPGMTSTLDRHFGTRNQNPAIPSRSLSSQHITSSTTGLAGSSRSPSMRRMRHLLELEQTRLGSIPNPSPVPTPSSTLPRSQTRQIDINPAEFLKYKIDKTGSGSGVGGLSLGSGTGSGIGAPDEKGVSGMLWVHLLAGRGLRSSAVGSTASTPVTPSGSSPSLGSTGLRDLYCVLECDRVHKARTVVRTGDLVFDWDESFELDLVNNKDLDLLIYSWDPQYRHKLCYKGSVHLPSLLRESPLHQLALKIEPRGTLYLRLRHTDSLQLYRRRGLPSLTLSRNTNPPLFGADLETVVNRESKTGGVPGGVATSLAMANTLQVPIIIKRCVEEIERRGLDIIGLYRLCGSATKKRILREAFERNSRSVDLTPDNVPDINVITGVLKDYLRELPEPLFTKCLYQMMVDALGVCLPDDPEGNAKLMFSILDCLPRINRATLIFLMDHLALVVSACDRNKMSAQNLAMAMGPPLMLHSAQATPGSSGMPSKTGEVNYEQPIGVLKYLLQIWPAPKSGRRARPVAGQRGDTHSASPVGRAAPPGAVSSRGPCRLSAGPCPPVARSAASVQPRGPPMQAQSHQTLGLSSVASKGPYRPLSPRVGPISNNQQQQQQPPPPGLKPRQVIVSSPGSPSSSSDSQSGSDSVKHCLPSSRVNSPAMRHSPTPSAVSGAGVHSPASGARPSPSITSLSRASPSLATPSRASPSLAATSNSSRCSSPAMQASSAGLAVTLNTSTPFSSTSNTIGYGTSNLAGIQTTTSTSYTSTGYSTGNTGYSSGNTGYGTGNTGYGTGNTGGYSSGNAVTSGYSTGNTVSGGYSSGYNYQPASYAPCYTQPTTYASTNPFLTGAYMQTYTPGDCTFAEMKFNGSYDKKPFYADSYGDTATKYNTLGSTKSSSGYNHENSSSPVYTSTVETTKYNTIGKTGYLSSGYEQPSGGNKMNGSGYDTSPNVTQSSMLLGIEDTPTPTSSIETEDSASREVGERDVEGDGEQSD
ncbi:Rho GTPase activating protein at 100F [Carabus blaptoides fortunei]